MNNRHQSDWTYNIGLWNVQPELYHDEEEEDADDGNGGDDDGGESRVP